MPLLIDAAIAVVVAGIAVVSNYGTVAVCVDVGVGVDVDAVVLLDDGVLLVPLTHPLLSTSSL